MSKKYLLIGADIFCCFVLQYLCMSLGRLVAQECCTTGQITSQASSLPKKGLWLLRTHKLSSHSILGYYIIHCARMERTW